MKRALHALPRHSVWAVRDMRIVLPGRALSAAGQGMAMVALVLHLHDSGVGPASTAALFGCLALPTVALMGIAGRVADRCDSRRVLVLGHLLEATACAGLAVVTAAPGGLPLPWWSCLPVVMVMQTGAAFANPVWSALVPRIVGDDRIGQAIGWQQGLSTAVAPVGAAAAGVLYGLTGPAVALAAAAVLVLGLVGAAAAVRTRRGGPSTGANETGAAPGIEVAGGGLHWIRTDALLGPLFVGLFVLVVCAEGVNVVEVFLARDALGATPQQYGFTEFCFALGAVIGALLAGRLTTTTGRAWGTIVGFGATAATLVAAGLAPHFWVYLVTAIGIGLANAYGNAANGALLMTRIPDAARGRVSSTLSGTMRLASILALVLGGLSGTWLGPRTTFVTGGILGVAVMAVASTVTALRLRRDHPSATLAPRRAPDPIH